LLTWLIFTCHAQASLLVEPALAPSPCFNVKPAEADVASLSSSHTEEALELLSLSPARGPHSPLSKLHSSSSSDSFDDWPKANDMAASVYVVLTADASSSHMSTVGAPHCTRKSLADDSCTQPSRTRAGLTQKPWRWKFAFTSAPQRKSKKMKVDAERALVVPILRGGSISAADFDRSEWEIKYPLFVEEGLIDPSKHVSQKDA
jgi:hypothetical protein